MWPSRGTGRRVLLAAFALLALLASGIGGFSLLGFPVPDAVYMTVMTLTTEGFSGADRLTEAGKLFTAALAVVGVAVFVAVLGLIGTALVEGRFGPAGRKRRMQHRIDALRDHFIVCAYGRVGQAVAREFQAEGVPFVMIENKADLEEQLQRERVPYLIGNAASEQVLRRAGIDHARGLVCAVDSDAENVYITLIAHSLNPSLAIVSRASEAASAERLTHAGASSVVSPYITSGRRMALLAVRPHVVDFLEFTRAGSSDVRIEEIRVDAGSRLVGRPLRQACGGALPLLIRRADGSLEPHPDPETAVQAGDTMIVFGDPGALRPIEDD
ncbi:TrkA family potassium uptake protein [Streptomyces sp. NPDC001835]|uniref:potassium channel family protein n=1 Tax=unclassified Streptomyces TaxID=2593676 RepID=UPI0033193402